MSLIEKLTKEQEDKMVEYRDKWMSIGLSTEPADREMAEKGIREAYKQGGIKTTPKIIWCGSPLSNGLTKSIVLDFKKTVVGDSVWASVWASVRTSVRASVRDSVRDSVWDSVRDSVRASVGTSVRNSVWASVRDSVWDSVGTSVRDSVYGQHDANWLGFYEYFNEVLNLKKQTEKLSGLWMIAKSAGWFLPYENICFISERHNVCRLKDGRLHSEGSPAIQYPDGFSVWGLNGVRVSQEIAETPSDKLDSKLILKEKNAEIRREIVRKIGIERICKDLNAECVDKVGDYELLLLDLQDGRKRPYLKMTNPSIGCYHVEGVHPDCLTVENALNWRNGSSKRPIQLT